jgi:hypothetical protein
LRPMRNRRTLWERPRACGYCRDIAVSYEGDWVGYIDYR